MIKKEHGFLSSLKDRLPVSRAEARRRAHKELIRVAKVQVAKGVMLGMTHALAQKHEPIEPTEKNWWQAQTAKWETVWRMLNEASTDLSDFRKISNLHQVADAAFQLYEQLTLNGASLMEVPSDEIRAEALRWRETATLIASLHRHCVMDKLRLHQTPGRKNAEESGIKDVKEI